jgi:hypothetical protein
VDPWGSLDIENRRIIFRVKEEPLSDKIILWQDVKFGTELQCVTSRFSRAGLLCRHCDAPNDIHGGFTARVT